MAEPRVTLMRFENPSQARFHAERLEADGITTFVENERVGEPPEPHTLPVGGGPVLLQVPESEAKRAGEVLQEGFDSDMGESQNPSVIP